MNAELNLALCPTCGGALDIKSDNKIMKCRFCRNTILFQEAIKQGKVAVDGIPTLADKINAGYTFLKHRDYVNALSHFRNALSLAPNNYKLWWGIVLAGTRDFTYYDEGIGIYKKEAKAAIEYAIDENEIDGMRSQYNSYIDRVNDDLDFRYRDRSWKPT